MSVDLKLVLLGHKNVGKTSLFNRYVYDEFGKTSMTIGAYFGMKQCKVNDRTCNLAIWDTAGEEKFDSLTNFYCRNARAALVCYDITNYETFQGLQRWVDKVTSEAEKNCACILVGNKLDIVEDNPQLRQVETAEAKRYASSIGALLVEASAKSGKNVNEMFEQLVLKCFEQQADTIYKQEPRQAFPKERVPEKASSGCC
jgi:small GTP-binding protein